ncbi:E3 ubiquitin-protein ligase ZNF598 [Brachionichthys hirsutus]|uniref:E3 ubiquitin-protein ligase ZNF598 n=1 Tax=Brachionichthys hirsutus TaxID=412623 RepID=UPI003604E249
MASTITKETDKHCVLCCEEVDIFAVGKCDHPVCYRCSTKMRVLCDQKYCAVCREELDKVVFVEKRVTFSGLPYQQFHCERNHDIFFSNEKIYSQYRRLLMSECLHCSEFKVFSKFDDLQQHMRRQHKLFSCKLCTMHLKIFSNERKWYDRKELARHRAYGDPDDTSHRGHPLCKFCDDRYLDNDELLKHLRRDHFFCHFCDADGSQEYYSDYQCLRQHFRESHYLCEEASCATEQFTHAFRSEIDFKAHKVAAHSKNRAEARHNRQIELHFNYAPRQQGRNEGLMTGEEYEEMSRSVRGGRTQRAQKSWRYSREDEEREVAAAMRASMAVYRQERRAVPERSVPKPRGREDRVERPDPEESRNGVGLVRPPVRTVKSPDPDQDDPPASGATAATSIIKPASMAVTASLTTLKEDDFPSLSDAAVPSLMTPAYSAQPKTTAAVKEEDFPALVSKMRPLRTTPRINSAWANNAAVAKPPSQPPPSSKQAPPPSSVTSVPMALSSSGRMSSRRKNKVGENGRATSTRSPPPPPSDDESGGLTQQEFRSVPTMLDISSLLTVKGGGSKTAPVAANVPHQTPNPQPLASKASKKNKRQKSTAAASPSTSSVLGTVQSASATLAETAAQKENVPAKTWNNTVAGAAAVALTSGLANGYSEKSSPLVKETVAVAPHPNADAPLEQEEEFPALQTKMPPPGFKSPFPAKASSRPPPPPGLGFSAAPKPPPGFTGIPLNSNVVEPAPPAVDLPPEVSRNTYLVPDDFNKRNFELIRSIRRYLDDDEPRFNEFKNYSAQFRQSVISAAQYHGSCKDLLGENFNRIFNELLALLPDTGKQQELLTAHKDSKAVAKQSGAGGGKKNKKNVWQTPATDAHAAAELDCQVCPMCRQVLACKDFNSHKTLHIGQSDEFPSLQSISRIIS